MSGSALPEVQNAVKAALAADAALSGMVTGVFDKVPAGQAYPYVLLGEKSETEFSTFARGGSRVLLGLDIRSQAPESTEMLAIYDRIREVLHNQPLDVAGYTVVLGTTTLLKTALDPDGVTHRGESRYEVIAQEA